MQLSSLLGFALVFIVLCWALSAVMVGGLRFGVARRRAGGPARERAALELAAVVPPAVGLAVAVVLMVRSATGPDHCLDHPHHPHLCLVHGAAWAGHAWVIAVVAVAGAMLAVRIGLVVAAVLDGRRMLRAMQPAVWPEGDVRIIDSSIPLCFVAGLRRPAIYISSAVWAALDHRQRAAVLAHERAHVAHRDLWRRLRFELLLVFAAPLPLGPVRRRWIAATEKLRDADAAEAVGSRVDVAQAMVVMARLVTWQRRSFAAFVAPGDLVTERVEAVLAGIAPDRGAARGARRAALGLGLALLTASVVWAGSLHHLFETLLG